MRAVLVGCGAMSKAWLEAARQIDGVSIAGLVDLDVSRARSSREGVRPQRHRDRQRSRRGPRRDEARRRVRRRRSGGAARPGAHRFPARLPSPDGEAARRQPRERATRSSRPRGRRTAAMRSCRTGATSRTCGASGAFSIPARSGRRPASTAISSSRRISAGFREEMRHVLLLDMAIHTFDAARFMVNGEPRERLLPGMGAEELLVPAGLVGGGDLRHGPRHRLQLSRKLVRRRLPHELGIARGASSASGARSSGTALTIFAPRRRQASARDFSTRSSRSKFRRSIRATGSAGTSASCRTSSRPSATARQPETDGADNIKSLAMVFGAIESAEAGRRVPIRI